MALPPFVDPPLTPEEVEKWHQIEMNAIWMMRNLMPRMEERTIRTRTGIFIEFITGNYPAWKERMSKAPSPGFPNSLDTSAIAAALQFGTPLRALSEAMRTTHAVRVPDGDGGWIDKPFEYTAHLPYLLSRIPSTLWRAMFAVHSWPFRIERDAPPITSKNKDDARNYVKSKRDTILTLTRITEHLSKRTCKDTALIVLSYVSWRK